MLQFPISYALLFSFTVFLQSLRAGEEDDAESTSAAVAALWVASKCLANQRKVGS